MKDIERPIDSVVGCGSDEMKFGKAGLAAVLLASVAMVTMARAETIEGALAKAYLANPDLNAQRAAVRANDENVPRALSGYRPRISATGDIGPQETTLGGSTSSTSSVTHPRGGTLSVDQTIYNFGRTGNSVAAAEAGVLSARQQLRSSEQQTLLDAAQAYMDVLRDTAFLDLRRANIDVLKEQLRQTQDRFSVGEVTRTDVAQVEARLASAQAESSAAEGTLKASIARYRQVIGADPKSLAPARPVEKLHPRTLDEAIRISQAEHPAIVAANHNVEVAEYQVKATRADLYPSLGVSGSAQKRWDYQAQGRELDAFALVGKLTVPLYEGGETYARVRQAKETLGQRRLEADLARERVRAAVVASWSQLEAARARIASAQAQVEASTIALNGVREEARVGQRTTYDVLVQDQELLSARVNLISAQRDRVVASYNVLSAMGNLSVEKLGLKVPAYDASAHYQAVRNRFIGTSID